MEFDLTPAGLEELSSALLQLAVTVGLGMVCVGLFYRFRKPYFKWWAAAWGLYALRLVAILSFLLTTDRHWLYWHQVVTGWTALALLWAALSFSRRSSWKWSYAGLALFPPVWSYIAIYRLDHFLWAALPAVLFLSAATLWTGLVFLRHHRRVDSRTSLWLALAFGLWAIHHLDYPLLRAQGAWTPWGYYLDIVFELGVGLGILFLVGEDLRRGLQTMAVLAGDLQDASTGGDLLEVLVERLLGLPAVTGAALYLVGPPDGFRIGAGSCKTWNTGAPPTEVASTVGTVVETQGPTWIRLSGERAEFASVIPVTDSEARSTGALVILSEARDPFTALDDRFLRALGHQMGAALQSDALHRALRDRTRALEQLSAQMVRSSEEERQRLSRELHDETAQVFAALSMELGSVRERGNADTAARMDTALGLVREAITGIRSVAEQLRPPLLDDLGLLPALSALIDDFNAKTGLNLAVDFPESVPPLSAEAELALFRALQEALSNVARHTEGGGARIALRLAGDQLELGVHDEGGWRPRDVPELGGNGLAGLRERLSLVGGALTFEPDPAGSTLQVRVPLHQHQPS